MLVFGARTLGVSTSGRPTRSNGNEGVPVTHVQLTTAKVAPPTNARARGEPEPQFALTRAEAHALRRSAPLTPAQFTELRRLAQQGVSPLRYL